MTTATEEFQAEIRPYMTDKSEADSPSAVVAEYIETRKKSLAQAEEIGVGLGGQNELCVRCVQAFWRRWMMLRYASIDLAFADAKQWAYLARTSRTNVELRRVSHSEPKDVERGPCDVVTQVNRFWFCELSATEFAFDGAEFLEESRRIARFAKGRHAGEYYPELDAWLHAAIPDGICERHRAATGHAVAWMAAGTSALYRHGVDPYNEANRGKKYRGYRTSYDHGRVALIWMPTKDVLSVTASPPRPKGDPLLVYQYASRDFVLDFFDTPDEESIEACVREFSEGRLPE